MKKFINVDEAFALKSPALSKSLPSSVKWLIKKIVHQDEINTGLNELIEDQGPVFCQKALERLGAEVEVEGLAKLDPNKTYIFPSNHPTGGIDGLVLIYLLASYFSKFKIIANDILTQVPNIADNMLPINRFGKIDQGDATRIKEAFSSKTQLALFPAGSVSKRELFKIKDVNWNGFFIKQAVKYRRNVVPVRITAKNSNLFYNLASIRRTLFCPINLEMFLLPHELFSQRGKVIKVRFCPEIPYTEFKRSQRPEKWANEIRDSLY